MMTEERLTLREQISALADGQLEGERFAAVVGQVGGDEEARDSWQVYHLIGDVLRSGESEACLHDRAFVTPEDPVEAGAVAPRMSVPALDAPERIAENGLSVLGKNQKRDFRHAANDGAYRWKMLAGLATVVAAAALGWSGLGGSARDLGWRKARFRPLRPSRPRTAPVWRSCCAIRIWTPSWPPIGSLAARRPASEFFGFSAQRHLTCARAVQGRDERDAGHARSTFDPSVVGPVHGRRRERGAGSDGGLRAGLSSRADAGIAWRQGHGCLAEAHAGSAAPARVCRYLRGVLFGGCAVQRTHTACV